MAATSKTDVNRTLHQRLTRIASSRGLKPERRPGLFSIERGGNLGLLHLAKARYSEQDIASYEPHLGVLSGRLSDVLGTPMSIQLPEPFVQHWYRSRVFIHDELDDDVWNDITDSSSKLDVVEDDFRNGLVPVLLEHLTDEGLRDCWMTYRDPSLDPVAQKAFLGILLSRIGPIEKLESVHMEIQEMFERGARVPPQVEPALAELRWL